MRVVTVDTEKSRIKVEGGALWEDVDKEAAKYGLATVGGTVNHTGNRDSSIQASAERPDYLTQASAVLL